MPEDQAILNDPGKPASLKAVSPHWLAQLLAAQAGEAGITQTQSRRLAYAICYAGYVGCFATVLLTNARSAYAFDVYLFALLAAPFITLQFAANALRRSIIFWACAVYLTAIGLASFAFPVDDPHLLSRHFRLIPLILSFLLVTGTLIQCSPKGMRDLMLTCATVVAASAAINMIAFVVNSGVPPEISIYRLVAVLGMPAYWNSTNVSATYLVYYAGAAAALFEPQLDRLRKGLFALAAAILLLALLMTQARSAYLAAAVSSALIAATNRRGRYALLLAICVLGLLVALPATREILFARGVSLRPEIWVSYFQMAEEHPLFGYGILYDINRALPDGNVIDQPHNLVLAAEVHGGLAAFGAMLIMLFGGIYWAARDWMGSKRLIQLSMIVAIVTAGMFDYHLLGTYPEWPWVTFWFPIALCISSEVNVGRPQNDRPKA
jgi:O-antigen ligase